jgi:hypothetical protein
VCIPLPLLPHVHFTEADTFRCCSFSHTHMCCIAFCVFPSDSTVTDFVCWFAHTQLLHYFLMLRLGRYDEIIMFDYMENLLDPS